MNSAAAADVYQCKKQEIEGQIVKASGTVPDG